jgi:methylmalonyl-CoA mutase N-terminal domain/subunit
MNMRDEVGCIGAGVGGGFENTTELHVMKYDIAMKTPDRHSVAKIGRRRISAYRR